MSGSVDSDHRWAPITSEGRLVYWHRRLPDGSWLAVSKSRDGEAVASGDAAAVQQRGAADGPWWMWMHCGPRSGVVNASAGGFDLSRQARDAADRYFEATTTTVRR